MKSKDFPEIAVLIITYARPNEIRITMDALTTFLQYPKEKLHIIVSDDSTGGRYLADIRRNKSYKEWGKTFTTIQTPERSGWGKHVNFALNYIRENLPQVEYVFQIEDDYMLTTTTDLQVGVALLETKPYVGMLRYRATAGMHTIFHQFEADISEYLPDFDESSGQIQGKLCYLQLDSGSHSAYLYSNGPHLKRLSWHSIEQYGLYPEGLPLGETEQSYAMWVKDKMKVDGAYGIVILPAYVTMKFAHIGHSWKGSEHDI